MNHPKTALAVRILEKPDKPVNKILYPDQATITKVLDKLGIELKPVQINHLNIIK